MWAGAFRGVFRSLSLIKILILARILTPAQFGIFGIATLILGLLEMLTETGVNVVLIQEKDNVDDYINTGWVVSILRGILISLLIIISIPFVVNFFNISNAVYILYLISVIPFIRGFINPAIIKYQKNLEFNKDFKFRSFLIFVEVMVTIVLAIITKSENALVWGLIISTLLETILSFILVKPIPKFNFNLTKLLNMISKGKWITGAKIFDYLFSHGDDIVVGRMLGSFSLGIYQQAYRITSLPIVEISEVFQRVTFPMYSKLIAENKKIIPTYIKTLFATLIIIIPFGILLFIFPTEIVLFVLGKNWLEAVPVLQILAIFGVIKTIANSVFPVLLAYKKQNLVMYLTLIGILGLGLSIYPLINIYGLIGAGLATIVGSLVMLPISFYWLFKTTYADINLK